MPYPTSLPLNSLRVLIEYFRDRSSYKLPTVVEHAYDVVGYALKLALGDGDYTPVVYGGDFSSLTDTEIADKLELLFGAHADPVGKLPDWLLPFVWQVIQDLLKRLLPTK